jgi:flavin-dependent dehydrogenase
MSVQPLTCDVVVLGGALSGAATALMLLRDDPALRVVIVERNEQFTRRVGEATVEVSGWFLCRALGLTAFLTQTQLTKNGLRFWFANDATRTLADCSEIGGRYLSTVPSFLVDRAALDEEVLRRAVELGATLLRPARIGDIALNPGGVSTVTVHQSGTTRRIEARWVVDASGVAALLARREGWLVPNEAHPTMSVWSRWRNVRDWDHPDLQRKYPDWAKAAFGIRNTATNHLVGDGWWAWWIQLKGGDVSIGIVFDQRRVHWKSEPGGTSLGERLRAFLSQHPAARELLEGAEFVEGDVHARRNLPYRSTRFAGDGFALVGDAAGFIDPFYSPGMDWICYTSHAAVRLIREWRAGNDLAPWIERHNREFTLSYERWFHALYRDKYDYLGDFEIMRLVFRLDIGLYYGFVARRPYFMGQESLCEPVYANAAAAPFAWLMGLYNRRFAAMARERRRRGTFGRANCGRRYLIGGFNFRVGQTARTVLGALARWGLLELTEGWRTWFRRVPHPKTPAPATAPAATVRVPVPA